jgi:hypothetical protein
MLPWWRSRRMEALPAAGPAAAGPELSSDRLELLAWLQRNAPSLAELYEGAVLMLENRPPAHVRLIAHSVREIRNRLPDYVSKVKSGGRLDYTGRIDNITKTWMRIGLLPSDLITAGLPPIDTSVAVPREAATLVLELLRDHELARAKPADTARRLFTSAAPENADVIETLEPVVQHWIDVTNWFMRRAHDDGRCDGDCPRNDLEHQFALFEKTLMAIVRQFYTAVDELDQILEDANS